MYTIKRAAELTGISLSTLRAWERRYGVIRPARSEGRYRLYSPEDLRALAIMASLVNGGLSAREAALETRIRVSDGAATPGEGASQGSGHARRDDLVEAARALDPAHVGDLLDSAFAEPDFDAVVDDWLMPALAGLGDAWADGRISVAGEHLVSYAVERRLSAAYDALARPPDGPTVVIGLPPGARHELGALAFAIAARRRGLATVYVGADLPTADWEAAVAASKAEAVVLAVPRAADVVPAREILERLRSAEPELLLGVGGGHQDEVAAGALPLGHTVGAAATSLAELLSQAPAASR